MRSLSACADDWSVVCLLLGYAGKAADAAMTFGKLDVNWPRIECCMRILLFKIAKIRLLLAVCLWVAAACIYCWDNEDVL